MQQVSNQFQKSFARGEVSIFKFQLARYKNSDKSKSKNPKTEIKLTFAVVARVISS